MTDTVRRRLIAVDPWDANGPGWSNSGVTAIYEVICNDGSLRIDNVTVYLDALSAEEHVAWKVAVTAIEVLKRRFAFADAMRAARDRRKEQS